MKTIIFLLLLFCTSSAFSQMHFSIPVMELDSIAAKDSSAFRMHPIQLDVDLKLTDFNTYGITAVTTFYEDISKNPYYKAKNTATTSELELPKAVFDLGSAVNPDKTYNVAKLNPILALFELKYRSPN